MRQHPIGGRPSPNISRNVGHARSEADEEDPQIAAGDRFSSRPNRVGMVTLAKARLVDQEHARKAVEMLIQASFTPDDIHVHARHPKVHDELPIRHRTRMPIFALIGALLGLAGGAFVGALVANGAISPLGPDLGVRGVVLPIVSGILVGIGMGAAWGAIAGMAFWREELNVPKAAQNGSIDIAVQAGSKRAAKARRILRDAGATEVR